MVSRTVFLILVKFRRSVLALGTRLYRQWSQYFLTSLVNSYDRYPGQEHVAGSTKIPTVLYYDHEGTIRCAGAEALLGQNIETAEDEGWFKVEW